MGYREWLYGQLIADGYLEEDDTTVDDLSAEDIMSFTQVTADDLESYKNEYTEYCANENITPEYDLPEFS